MQQVVLLVHVCVAVCLVVLVLLQQGRGATVGAAFGSGASQSLFGSRGATSFLAKVTTILAIIFFATSLLLARLAAHPRADYTAQPEQQRLSIPVDEVSNATTSSQSAQEPSK